MAELELEERLTVDLLAGFVRDEVTKVGVKKLVLGLSGGVDSSLSAFLAARAMGPGNVTGVIMPYRTSSPQSEADARAVAGASGIQVRVVEISAQIDAYFERFPDADRLRRGNKMARERMTILYDHSALLGALVVGTSNKTELMLGYGTLYGDMASAVNPIGDLYKTQIRQLSAWIGVPRGVVEKAPTADLWTGQTDEQELGYTYAEADAVLYRMFDCRWGREDLIGAGFPAGLVDGLQRLVQRSQYKRRLPLIAKVSHRTIDRDFRYARDWGL
ncbi:MAG: NAD(+) synthetase [Candidatus Tectomicrobia bacterium RIFCSPLOWO2_12_FULL_69_37]|nr:MAG: NAD(+) synthetase [Candidatus Tectomicrobia bacterium RIFCSPLOWO2_02_FULL_70_19]OGL68410.1 MAG: NAD(+) synthetase [Candidatus Tectomicrobia bacterium RIFCSPLOWO2_12_FULL_69_37]